jgi:hypothetical protein
MLKVTRSLAAVGSKPWPLRVSVVAPAGGLVALLVESPGKYPLESGATGIRIVGGCAAVPGKFLAKLVMEFPQQCGLNAIASLVDKFP